MGECPGVIGIGSHYLAEQRVIHLEGKSAPDTVATARTRGRVKPVSVRIGEVPPLRFCVPEVARAGVLVGRRKLSPVPVVRQRPDSAEHVSYCRVTMNGTPLEWPTCLLQPALGIVWIEPGAGTTGDGLLRAAGEGDKLTACHYLVSGTLIRPRTCTAHDGAVDGLHFNDGALLSAEDQHVSAGM